jgi:hypothetical protein
MTTIELQALLDRVKDEIRIFERPSVDNSKKMVELLTEAVKNNGVLPCVSTRDFEELYEAVKVELHIIKNLITSKRVVNLDEAIAYYENLLKKHEHHVC